MGKNLGGTQIRASNTKSLPLVIYKRINHHLKQGFTEILHKNQANTRGIYIHIHTNIVQPNIIMKQAQNNSTHHGIKKI